MENRPCVNILLVDDAREHLLALEGLLGAPERRLFKACGAEEVLQLLRQEEFALILLAVQTPGCRGFQTAALIKQREETRHIPILFLMAFQAAQAPLFEGTPVGAVDYLFEPFNARMLQSKVAVFCELHAKTRRLIEQAEALRQANQQLKEAERYKDEFLSVISHELRTPLNFIMGFASILEDGVAGDLVGEQPCYVHKILQGAERMLTLVNDLLDFAKFQAGKFDFVPEFQPLQAVVDEVAANLKPLAESKRIEIIADCPASVLACFDRGRLAQVLMNLVGNAIKFTPAGGVVSIRVHPEAHEAVVEVEDTGIGIAEADFPKLFTRFRQLDMSTTREAGGTGLGLSIAKALVEAHGGTICARSDGPNQGATFSFTVPMALAADVMVSVAPRPSWQGP